MGYQTILPDSPECARIVKDLYEDLRNLYHSWEERTTCRLLCSRTAGESLLYGTWTAVVCVGGGRWANALSTPGVFKLWLLNYG